MNQFLAEVIEQLKLSGVQEVSFTIKFADSNPIPKAVKTKNKATVIEVPKPEPPQIPQEMLLGDL